MVICVCNTRAEEKRRDGSPGLTSLFVQPNMWALIVKDCFRKEKGKKEKHRWMASGEKYARKTHAGVHPLHVYGVATFGGTCCFEEVHSWDTLNSAPRGSHLGIVYPRAGKAWGWVQPRGHSAPRDACCSAAPCLPLAFLSWSRFEGLGHGLSFFPLSGQGYL